MNDNYLAILISDQGFMISRPINMTLRDNPMFLADYMARQAHMNRDDIDTILVVENGNESPEVVHHYEPGCWSEDD